MEAYLNDVCSRYRGLHLAVRLRAAADGLTGDAQARALGLALDELKRATRATELYKLLAARTGATTYHAYDAAWVEAEERSTVALRAIVERQINTETTNMIRENIRRAYMDLASLQMDCGDLVGAIRSWSRCREYTTTAKQTAECSVGMMEAAVLARQWPVVEQTVGRHDVVTEASANPLVLGKARAAAALLCLGEGGTAGTGRYREVAESLMGIPPALVDVLPALDAAAAAAAASVAALAPSSSSSSSSAPPPPSAPLFGLAAVLHPDDVASLLALTTLATWSREQLRDALVGPSATAGGKALLEGSPRLRDAVGDYVGGRYARALGAVHACVPELRLDLHVGPHVDALVAAITQRALTQYLAPFSRVDLGAMAGAFNMRLPELEGAVQGLIASGAVAARIDAQAHVLTAARRDPRGDAVAAALAGSRTFASEARVLLLRASLADTEGGGGGASSRGSKAGRTGSRSRRAAASRAATVALQQSLMPTAASGGSAATAQPVPPGADGGPPPAAALAAGGDDGAGGSVGSLTDGEGGDDFYEFGGGGGGAAEDVDVVLTDSQPSAAAAAAAFTSLAAMEHDSGAAASSAAADVAMGGVAGGSAAGTAAPPAPTNGASAAAPAAYVAAAPGTSTSAWPADATAAGLAAGAYGVAGRGGSRGGAGGGGGGLPALADTDVAAALRALPFEFATP